jgi:hypothetical protein
MWIGDAAVRIRDADSRMVATVIAAFNAVR